MGIQGVTLPNITLPTGPSASQGANSSGLNLDESSFDGVTHNAKVAAALGASTSAPAWQSLLPPGWTPAQGVTPPVNAAQQQDLSYIKMVMAETAVMTGHANTSDADMQKAYDYWIPKMLTIGNPPAGCDSYWVGRLLQPDTGGATVGAFGSSTADDALETAIQQILDGPGSDEDKQRLIRELLAKHGKTAAGAQGAGAAGGK